jgi:hypothetical protein
MYALKQLTEMIVKHPLSPLFNKSSGFENVARTLSHRRWQLSGI